ncbi:uncharacterized protein VDAG_00208 [Verticillium dahliae VdLs.17]|uniref:AN1-type domain-containing protein n=1 Tax=Verticillium dahliae (strain VdLs.17 / ATCC MYA-4575 / FGSC 10137) TaxID=498257 RepID=G2WRM5_VERDV|nr:uncharacterized protein VDAG_00208 [Verticillium dahliae VdLs.17]EGY13526.1 hypothetical protein VDAG_00208 [Verticillium dahliae VdLs.17]KAF3344408.1 hypothetical protein VdG2_07507 [Verticillium dahliae VDG2]
MPAKKIRCTAKDCRDAAQRIVGDCGFCQGHFCGKHRLLEDHKCSGLEDCKKESHERNAAQLESERTQMIRGVAVSEAIAVAVTIDERLQTRRCD